MAPNRRHQRWGWFTDLLALRGNADDQFVRILQHSRDPYIIDAAGKGRHELEKQRQHLIDERDRREIEIEADQ